MPDSWGLSFFIEDAPSEDRHDDGASGRAMNRIAKQGAETAARK